MNQPLDIRLNDANLQNVKLYGRAESGVVQPQPFDELQFRGIADHCPDFPPFKNQYVTISVVRHPHTWHYCITKLEPTDHIMFGIQVTSEYWDHIMRLHLSRPVRSWFIHLEVGPEVRDGTLAASMFDVAAQY